MLKSDSDSVFAELAWSPPTCHIEDVLESDTTAAGNWEREARGGHCSLVSGQWSPKYSLGNAILQPMFRPQFLYQLLIPSLFYFIPPPTSSSL